MSPTVMYLRHERLGSCKMSLIGPSADLQEGPDANQSPCIMALTNQMPSGNSEGKVPRSVIGHPHCIAGIFPMILMSELVRLRQP
jgi:hypothetical protein